MSEKGQSKTLCDIMCNAERLPLDKYQEVMKSKWVSLAEYKRLEGVLSDIRKLCRQLEKEAENSESTARFLGTMGHRSVILDIVQRLGVLLPPFAEKLDQKATLCGYGNCFRPFYKMRGFMPCCKLHYEHPEKWGKDGKTFTGSVFRKQKAKGLDQKKTEPKGEGKK